MCVIFFIAGFCFRCAFRDASIHSRVTSPRHLSVSAVSVVDAEIDAFMDDANRQASLGRFHTAFIVQLWRLPASRSAAVRALPRELQPAELAKAWRDQEAADKAVGHGRGSIVERRFTAAYYDGLDSDPRGPASAIRPLRTAASGKVVDMAPGSLPHVSVGATGASASMAAAATDATTTAAATTASSSANVTVAATATAVAATTAAASVAADEATLLRAKNVELTERWQALQSECDGLARNAQRADDEARGLRTRLAEVEAAAAARASEGLRRRDLNGTPPAQSLATRATTDALASTATGFPLWQILLVIIAAFLIGRLSVTGLDAVNQ